MTITTPENKVENTLAQEKVDTNLTQQKVDTNLTQKPIEIETTEDPNWKVVRENLKKAKQEREIAEKKAIDLQAQTEALKAAMEAAFSKSSPPQQQMYSQDGYQPEETEDERIEKKVQAALAAREQAYEKTRHEKERQELPDKLRDVFSDYDQVVNEENGAYMAYHYPEIYRSLIRQPENFQTCSDIYKVVKKMVPNSTTAKKEAQKADNNFSKPKSISSIGLTQSQETSSGRLTEERKAANYERMQKMLKSVG
jgi:hypothetical protein